MNHPFNMQHNFKQSILTFMMAAIAVFGLSACSTTDRTPSIQASNTIASNSIDTDTSPVKAGSSTSTVNLLQILATAYESTSEIGEIDIDILEPSQSEAAIVGVEQQVIDVGLISKTLKPEETGEMLNFRPVAEDALLVATHPSVTGVTNLNTADLRGIYSGTITNWKELGGPDAQILLLDRPEDESAKRLLREHYLGQDLPNSPNAIILRKEGELIQTLQSTPYSIGAFSLAYAISQDLPVNHLSLDGVAPTSENLKTDRYQMARTISVISNKNTSDTTQAFVNYIFSPLGVNMMEQSGFVPFSSPIDPEEKK